jgi:hypothetical protein
MQYSRKVAVLFNAILFCACFFVFPALASAMSVDFSWVPNSEPSVVGYKIHYGTTSGVYQNVVDIKNTAPDPSDGRIHGTVTGLTDGTKYYFVCTAYDNQGNESAYSREVVFGGTDVAPLIKAIQFM